MRRKKWWFSLILLVFGLGLAVLITQSARRRDLRAQEFEGKAGARALCLAVSEYHQARGVWILAGPTPPTIPGPEGAHFPPARDFQQLGFDPGQVHFQYEVRANGEGRECVARGDPDGDGLISVFTAQAP